MKKRLIVPKQDRLLTRATELDDLTHSTIIIPDMGKEKPQIVEVLAVGPGRMSEFGTFIEVASKVGDIVLVPKMGTLRVELDEIEYLIVQDKEVLAVIRTVEDEE
jgi:chaperonin GroES